MHRLPFLEMLFRFNCFLEWCINQKRDLDNKTISNVIHFFKKKNVKMERGFSRKSKLYAKWTLTNFGCRGLKLHTLSYFGLCLRYLLFRLVYSIMAKGCLGPSKGRYYCSSSHWTPWPTKTASSEIQNDTPSLCLIFPDKELSFKISIYLVWHYWGYRNWRHL